MRYIFLLLLMQAFMLTAATRTDSAGKPCSYNVLDRNSVALTTGKRVRFLKACAVATAGSQGTISKEDCWDNLIYVLLDSGKIVRMDDVAVQNIIEAMP